MKDNYQLQMLQRYTPKIMPATARRFPSSRCGLPAGKKTRFPKDLLQDRSPDCLRSAKLSIHASDDTHESPPEQPPHAGRAGSSEPTKSAAVKVDEGSFVLHVAQIRRRRLPAPALRLGPGRLAHAFAEFGVSQLI